jgi:hypothetical protein
MIINLKKDFNLIKVIFLLLVITPLFIIDSFASTYPISPEEIIKENQQAKYFEKYLGWIEVGKTKKELLEKYIGKGYTIKNNKGEKVYFIDKKNKRTLIVETNYKDIIEVALYKSEIELPPNIKSLNEIKTSKLLNIKNLMTSMGSRIGFNGIRIIGAYGRPSVEIIGSDFKELKYIILGSYNKDLDFVYLEYSFRLKKNKVYEIRIENGR